MGSVIQLKTKINNAYLDLRNSVEHKLELVEDKIKNKLKSWRSNQTKSVKRAPK